MSREVVSCVAAAGAAATATFVLAKMLYHSEVATLRRQFVQSEDNVAQLVEEYGVQLQTKASMASELVEFRDQLTAAQEREAVLEQQLTESEEQRRAVQQQLEAVKGRVESLQAQLVILQGALEEVAASGALGSSQPITADAADASPEELAAAAALEAQRLRGQVAQLEAQCRLRDIEAGQLRASLQEVQRRYDDAVLQAAAAETARAARAAEHQNNKNPPHNNNTLCVADTPQELQLLRDEIQVLKRQLSHRMSSSAPLGGSTRRPRLARCDSDASDAASAASSTSGRRVHRPPGVSTAFTQPLQRGPSGASSTAEEDAFVLQSGTTASPAEASGEENAPPPGPPWPVLRRTVSAPKQHAPAGPLAKHPGHAVQLRPTAHPAHSAPAALDPPTPVPSGEPSVVSSAPERFAVPQPPLARSASGGVDLPERSISVRTSLQTWEALAALSAQGNKGLVVPSPRKLYWAGYKGVRLHDDA